MLFSGQDVESGIFVGDEIESANSNYKIFFVCVEYLCAVRFYHTITSDMIFLCLLTVSLCLVTKTLIVYCSVESLHINNYIDLAK